MRSPPLFVALILAAATSVAASFASDRSARTVLCNEVILHTKFPYPNSGYRLVLGTVSAPPAYLQQVVRTDSRPWAYWRKAGLVVRAGTGPVQVSVPTAWRSRAAITWGNNTGIVSSLRIARCGQPSPVTGNAYSGGFYLRAPSACVPLTLRVGRRSETVRFGVGRRCGTS